MWPNDGTYHAWCLHFDQLKRKVFAEILAARDTRWLLADVSQILRIRAGNFDEGTAVLSAVCVNFEMG